MEVNEEKRKKFMEYAGKRVNNVLHDIQILEPMARSNTYDFTKQDVEEMFYAMQESLNNAKVEFDKKFEEKARTERKVFSFGGTTKCEAVNTIPSVTEPIVEDISEVQNINIKNVEDTENTETVLDEVIESNISQESDENIDTNIF